jgi:hypothetical protein
MSSTPLQESESCPSLTIVIKTNRDIPDYISSDGVIARYEFMLILCRFNWLTIFYPVDFYKFNKINLYSVLQRVFVNFTIELN